MSTHNDFKDIYLIPCSDSAGLLVYAPLQKQVFWVNSDVSEIMNDYIYNGIDIPKEYIKLKENIQKICTKKAIMPPPKTFRIGNKVVFILSQKCNLACSYCYAKQAHSNEVLDKSKIKTAINKVLTSSEHLTKEFLFIGGGEPMITWELLVWSVNYIEYAAIGQKISFSITTNGTLINGERAKWLKEHNFHVGISFDILPEIQNEQRSFVNNAYGSFDAVDKGIKVLIRQGIVPRIRATITKQNVRLMPDMVEFVVKHYPEVKWLHFEHVSDININQEKYYDDFVTYFFKARNIGELHGVVVKNSITTSIHYIRSSFCAGEFCITPTGDLVSCHRVSSSRDELFDTFAYGHVDDEIIYKGDAINVIQNYDFKLKKCDGCFAKWHCAGGCAYNKLIYSTTQFDSLCHFTRKMLVRTLEEQIAKNIRDYSGTC